MLGASPFAAGAPANQAHPLVLDMCALGSWDWDRGTVPVGHHECPAKTLMLVDSSWLLPRPCQHGVSHENYVNKHGIQPEIGAGASEFG